jgi:hypothetical protein
VAVDGVALGHLHHDGRHERRDRDAVPLHELEHPGGVEALHDHERRAGAHPAEEDGVQRVHVEHGQDAEDDVVLPEVEVRVVAVDELRHAGHQPAVRQHDPLGQPRRAGRVRQRDHVVHHVDSRLLRRRRRFVVGGGEVGERDAPLGAVARGDDGDAGEPAHLGDERRLGDDDGGAGGGGLLGDLGRGVERVGRGGGGAEAGACEERQRELDGVGEQQHHRAAGAHAERGAHPHRHAARQAVHVAEREHLPRGPVDEAGAVAAVGQALEDVVVEREVVRDGDVRERRAEHRLGRRLRRQRPHLLPGGGGRRVVLELCAGRGKKLAGAGLVEPELCARLQGWKDGRYQLLSGRSFRAELI